MPKFLNVYNLSLSNPVACLDKIIENQDNIVLFSLSASTLVSTRSSIKVNGKTRRIHLIVPTAIILKQNLCFNVSKYLPCLIQ